MGTPGHLCSDPPLNTVEIGSVTHPPEDILGAGVRTTAFSVVNAARSHSSFLWTWPETNSVWVDEASIIL